MTKSQTPAPDPHVHRFTEYENHIQVHLIHMRTGTWSDQIYAKTGTNLAQNVSRDDVQGHTT